ncbi:MAG: zinc ribbon domain-containing protein [Candidatus Lokiarchaeia archaeon]
MSSSNLEIKWNKIGKKLRSIGGLFILIIIPYIAFAALTIQFILIIALINDLNDINRELKNPHLDEFRSRYLASSIIKFAGAIILNIACTMLVGVYFISFYGPILPNMPFGPFIRFIPIIVLFIIGFVLMIVGSSIEIGAWDNLKSFITQNKEMFPKMGKEALDGAEKLKTGATFWMLGFLIIPIVIGWIFHLIGYFTLSKIADQELVISKEPIRTVEPQYVYVTAPAPTHAPKPVSTLVQDTDKVNFCPLCGAKVNNRGLYCGECGTQVRD